MFYLPAVFKDTVLLLLSDIQLRLFFCSFSSWGQKEEAHSQAGGLVGHFQIACLGLKWEGQPYPRSQFLGDLKLHDNPLPNTHTQKIKDLGR